MGCTHCSKFFYSEEQVKNANNTCRGKRRRRSPGVIRRIFSRKRNRVQPSQSETSSEASTTRGPPSGASTPVVPNYDIFCTDRTSRKSKSSCSSTLEQAIEQATAITETFTEKTRPEFEEEEKTSGTYKPAEVPEEAPEVPDEAQEELPDKVKEETPEEDLYKSSYESQETQEAKNLKRAKSQPLRFATRSPFTSPSANVPDVEPARNRRPSLRPMLSRRMSRNLSPADSSARKLPARGQFAISSPASHAFSVVSHRRNQPCPRQRD